MWNDIFNRLKLIIFWVFVPYLALLYIYDFYFYKKLYVNFCSTFYCLENIEFKDFASILATLMGSGLVAYSLFSWKDNFKYNLVKSDLERFRFSIHELKKNLESQKSCFSDPISYMEELYSSYNYVPNSFSNIIHDYPAAKLDLSNLRNETIKVIQEFKFERTYYELHGGKLNISTFDKKLREMISELDKLHNSFNNDNIPQFKNEFQVFTTAYKSINQEINSLLKETYKLLSS